MKFLAIVRVIATTTVIVDTFSKREAARIAKRMASDPARRLTILPGTEKCDPDKNVQEVDTVREGMHPTKSAIVKQAAKDLGLPLISLDSCANDTNGDGDCGRPTCAQYHPEHQPVTVLSEDVVTRYGFSDSADFHRLVASADISIPDKRAAFEKWKAEDGTKDGLLALQQISNEE